MYQPFQNQVVLSDHSIPIIYIRYVSCGSSVIVETSGLSDCIGKDSKMEGRVPRAGRRALVRLFKYVLALLVGVKAELWEVVVISIEA